MQSVMKGQEDTSEQGQEDTSQIGRPCTLLIGPVRMGHVCMQLTVHVLRRSILRLFQLQQNDPLKG